MSSLLDGRASFKCYFEEALFFLLRIGDRENSKDFLVSKHEVYFAFAIDSVIHEFPPITEPLPMTVSPPRIVAFA